MHVDTKSSVACAYETLQTAKTPEDVCVRGLLLAFIAIWGPNRIVREEKGKKEANSRHHHHHQHETDLTSARSGVGKTHCDG